MSETKNVIWKSLMFQGVGGDNPNNPCFEINNEISRYLSENDRMYKIR